MVFVIFDGFIRIGDFGDIKLMTDWLVSTGQNILQLLPVNDTTVYGGNEDSYPYNCVSVFALNPISTDLSPLPQLSKARRNAFYQKEREALNALPAVDYAKVYRLKINYLRELFDEVGADVLLRGVRNVKDFEYERELADVKRQIGGIDTVLLMSEPGYSSVSSSVVRELMRYGKDVSDLLP